MQQLSFANTYRFPKYQIMQQISQHAIEINTVIYIGASSVSMLLTSAITNEEVDFLEQSIPIAHDIFSKDRISKSSIERAVRIIRGYLDNIAEYGPQKPESLKIVATNILYEATNNMGWRANSDNRDQWLMADLQDLRIVAKISTQDSYPHKNKKYLQLKSVE